MNPNDDLQSMEDEAGQAPMGDGGESSLPEREKGGAGWTTSVNPQAALAGVAAIKARKRRRWGIGLGVGGIGATILTIFLLPTGMVGTALSAVERFGGPMVASSARHYDETMGVRLKSGTCSGARCEFQKFSQKELSRLEKAGAKMSYDGVEVRPTDDGGKVLVDTIELDGRTLTASSIADEMARNPNVRARLHKVYNPKFESTGGKAWRTISTKFGLSKGKNLKGNTTDDVLKSLDDLTRAKTNEDLPKFADAEAKDVEKAMKELDPSPAQKIGQTAYDTVSLSGGLPNYFCGVFNGARMVNIGSKVVRKAWMIPMAFAMLNLFSSIQANEDTTMQDVEAAGNMLTGASADGRDFFNSYGANYAMYGDSGDLTESAASFTLGGNGPFIGITAGITSLFLWLGLSSPKSVCGVVRNPVVQFLDLVGGGLLAFFTGGGIKAGTAVGKVAAMDFLKSTIKTTLKRPAFWGALTFEAAIALLPIYLQNVLGGQIPSEMTKENQSDAFFSASEGLYGELAQAGANAPLTKDQAIEMDKQTALYERQVAAEERAMRSPFDTSSQYTFLGSIVHSLTPRLASITSGWSFINKFSSILSSGFLSLFAQASAANVGAEYEICDDDDYRELNLATSPFCNVKYGLPDFVGFDDTEKYMKDGGYISDDYAPLGEFAEFIDKCIGRTEPLGFFGESDLTMDDGKGCLLNAKTKYFYNWQQYMNIDEGLADS
ncbi:MAG: hypothetical protein LBK50_00875 [Candidatus Nomurabacteria bacterium]|jgi:hypothetical protein|nr:hypothetical protein [Candidatus Nomurabacteria bacterium]